jgi:hypothetical protein
MLGCAHLFTPVPERLEAVEKLGHMTELFSFVMSEPAGEILSEAEGSLVRDRGIEPRWS